MTTFPLIVPMLGLAGETGQLLSEYKKHLRDGEAHRLFKERVSEELGDLLWYIANVASKFDLTLDEIAVATTLSRLEHVGRPTAPNHCASMRRFPKASACRDALRWNWPTSKAMTAKASAC